MRASGSAYQPWMTGLPALSLVMSRGCWRAVVVIAVRDSIASREYMVRVWLMGEERRQWVMVVIIMVMAKQGVWNN